MSMCVAWDCIDNEILRPTRLIALYEEWYVQPRATATSCCRSCAATGCQVATPALLEAFRWLVPML